MVHLGYEQVMGGGQECRASILYQGMGMVMGAGLVGGTVREMGVW